MKNKTQKSQQQDILFQPFVVIALIIMMLGVGISIVQATLLSEPNIISAPAVISNDQPTNTKQQAFNERQHVTLTEDVRCSNTTIPAGEIVNSHMIFYNTAFNSPEVDANRVWEFDAEVVCVMAEQTGLLQALTDNSLGALGTNYPGPFDGRGLEEDGSDSYSISGNTLTVTMTAEEPGDWIRVLTRYVPPPDNEAPIVYCNHVTKNADGKGGGNVFELIGADNADGTVALYLTDDVSGEEFGPFVPGTTIRHSIAKGATPGENTSNNKAVDFSIKAQGELTISATDEAGNTGSEQCTS